MRADGLAARLELRKFRHVADAGGGPGTYAAAFCRQNPELKVTLIDLPQTLPIARELLKRAGLQKRIGFRAADLYDRRADLGSGYDMTFVSAVFHAYGEQANRALCRRLFDATAPGGRIVVQEGMLDPDRTSPREPALFSVNMLVATRDGRSYTFAEIADWLTAAGFRKPRRLPRWQLSSVVIADKPK
ncbi:MAG: methyltransferase [Pseudomonadota bacterium]